MNPEASAASGSAPVVSQIRPGQVEAALGLFVRQMEEHGIKADAGRMRGILHRVIADERHGFILVATVECGLVVGVAFGSAFLGLEHGGESGWLEELYVLPDWRQKGVGSHLVAAVVERARSRGWRAIDLEVTADHQRAVALYVRHGFQSRGRSRFYLPLA
jgi:ribosomal protein S18 acetylase RimI-like enzyme